MLIAEVRNKYKKMMHCDAVINQKPKLKFIEL